MPLTPIGLEGFLLQASLILALGAQNLFVLESGLRRQHHALVATICFLCDFALILVGVLGGGTLFREVPILKLLFGILGCGFLIYYGVKKLGEAVSPVAAFSPTATPRTLKKVVWTTLGFSLLNPHVYLDTVVLIGSYSSRFPTIDARLAFGLGAAAFSGVWFYCLAFLAAACQRLVHNPKAMRFIFLVSGLILLYLGIVLGAEVARGLSPALSAS